MKKIIRLTEKDLSNIIKQIIFEQKTIGFVGIKENTVKDVVNNLNPKKKIIKDKWGRTNIKNGKPSLWFGFDPKAMKWVDGPCKGIYKDNKTCKKILGLSINSKINSKLSIKSDKETYCRKNIRIASPDESTVEKITVNIGKTFGIIQFIVSSQSDLIDKLSTIKSKRIEYGCNRPLDSIVIGSHGNIEGKIIFTDGGTYYKDNEKILNALKPLVGENTTLFFTACYGADFLMPLKYASQFLGTRVRGSSGIYAPILNISYKGFYECSPSPKFDIKNLYKKDNEPYRLGDISKNRKLVNSERINNYLLKNNMCKKVNSSGIGWFN